MKKLLKKILRKIKLRTWIAIALIVVLSPIGFLILNRIEAAPTPPTAYWKLDEGVDNTCSGGTNDACDSMGSYDASNSGATWQPESMCMSGRCLLFDGSNDVVSVGSTVSNIRSISFWVKVLSTSTTEQLIDLNGTDYVTSVSGTITVAGFGSDTIYIDGVVGSTITANNWHHVEITTTSDFSGSAIKLGQISTNYGNFFMDDIKLFTYQRSASEVKTDVIKNASDIGSSASFGSQNSRFLSQGLTGYWKLDDASGNATDSSGNGLTLTNGGSTTYVTGKYGHGSEHVPASSHYLSTATTISGVKTISFWVNPDSTTNYYASLTSSAYITSSSGTLSATGFTNPTIYVNGVISSTIVADSWQFVTVTTDTAINANQFYLGRQSTNYFDGTLDEARVYTRALSPAEVSNLYAWAPDPTGYWPMDENTGQYVFDKSGNGNTGTLGDDATVEADDPSWGVGKFGGSTSYNGGTNDKKIEIVDGTGLNNVSSNLTTMAWVMRTGSASFTNPMNVIDKRNGGGAGYELKLASVGGTDCNDSANDGTSVCFNISDGTDSYYMFTSGAGILADSTWHHVAAVFDRNNESKNKIYIDGVAQTVTIVGTLSSIDSATNTNRFCIGVVNGGADCGTANEFNGSIDEVRIYNYARTPGQIIEDMNGGHPTGGSPIGTQVGYWKMNEMTGTTLYDAVGNNDMTLNNSPTFTSAGKIDHAVTFSGFPSGQSASIQDNSSLSITSNLSLSAWINPSANTGGSRYPIAGKSDGSNTSYLLEQYGGEIRMYVNSASIYATTTSANLQTGTWYHVVGVYDAGAQTITIYVNGVKQPATTTGTVPSSITDRGENFLIATNNPGSTQVTYQITSNSDDGTETNNTTWTDSPSLSRNGFGYYSGVYNDVEPGLRFQNVTIPQGATISSAVLQVYSEPLTGTATSVHGKIYADDVDNAAAWGASSRPSQITTTTAAVDWDPSAWSTGVWYDSPSIATVVQEIVDRGSWASGNAMRFAIWNDGTTGGNVASFEDALGVPSNAAKLVVTYTTGAATYNFAGTVDEVKLYSSALSPEQVRVDMNANAVANFGVGSNEADDLTDTAGNPPVAYWSMDENTGTTSTADLSGNSYTMTMNGSMTGNDWVPGRVGSALDFDGSNDFLSNASYIQPDVMTASAWAKFPVNPTGSQRWMIVSNRNGAYDYSYSLSLDPVLGTVRFIIMKTGAAGGHGAAETPMAGLMDDNKWHFYTGTYDGSDIKLYVDGVLMDTTNDPSTLYNANNSTYIGRNYDGTSTIYTPGIIDEVKIYDYARTPAQIAYDYNRGAPVSWYKLDECTGTTIYDSAKTANGDATGNNGTWSGATGTNTSAGTCSSGTGSEAWNNGTTGKLNASLDFDGTDDIVTANPDFRVDNLTQITITAWIYPDSFGENSLGRIADKNQVLSGGWAFYLDSGGFCGGTNQFAFHHYWTTGPSARGTWCAASNTISTGKWQHIAVTYDSSSTTNDASFYVNGKLVGSSELDTPSGTTGDDSSIELTIGNRTAANRTFDGRLDDVRIYNYKLSADQIKKVMNEGSAVRFGPGTGSP